MTKKVTFNWGFKCVEDERALDVYLNGGLNKSLYFDYEDYYKNLAGVLKEISFYQSVVGNKTNVLGFEDLNKVDQIRKTQPIEVVKKQQLERKGLKS